MSLKHVSAYKSPEDLHTRNISKPVWLLEDIVYAVQNEDFPECRAFLTLLVESELIPLLAARANASSVASLVKHEQFAVIDHTFFALAHLLAAEHFTGPIPGQTLEHVLKQQIVASVVTFASVPSAPASMRESMMFAMANLGRAWLSTGGAATAPLNELFRKHSALLVSKNFLLHPHNTPGANQSIADWISAVSVSFDCLDRETAKDFTKRMCRLIEVVWHKRSNETLTNNYLSLLRRGLVIPDLGSPLLSGNHFVFLIRMSQFLVDGRFAELAASVLRNFVAASNDCAEELFHYREGAIITALFGMIGAETIVSDRQFSALTALITTVVQLDDEDAAAFFSDSNRILLLAGALPNYPCLLSHPLVPRAVARMEALVPCSARVWSMSKAMSHFRSQLVVPAVAAGAAAEVALAGAVTDAAGSEETKEDEPSAPPAPVVQEVAPMTIDQTADVRKELRTRIESALALLQEVTAIIAKLG